MRRTVLLLGLALVLGFGLSGIGTAAEQEPQAKAVHPPMPVPLMPVPPGITPMEPPTALAPVGPQVPGPLAPPIVSGFEAVPDNNLAIPPDTHGAVGPTKIMTVLNTEYLVQLRDGTPVGVPQSLNSFWSGLATASAFDPRVKFDPDPTYGGRWIWVAAQGAVTYDSGTLVAVSPGVEPVRGFGVLVDADSNVSPDPIFWTDYPTVGFNKNWVVVQVNLFDDADPASFQRSLIYVFDKARLYGGTTGPCVPAPSATGCTLIDATGLGATQVPAATYDFTLEEMYLLNTWNWIVGVLRLFRLDGPIGNETLTALGLPAAPPWSNSAPGRVDFAPQSQAGDGCFDELGAAPLCPDCRLQTNDSRVQNLVFRNGTLWTAQTVFYPDGGSPSRSSIQWWQIAPDASVVQRGLIDDSLSQERFYAFPSIAVNRHSDVLLGYSSFHATEYAAARYSFRYGTDPVNTLQPERALKAGEDCYFKDLGSGRNRWGDYSHTVVDPTDDTKLWTVQEYAAMSDSANPSAILQDKWSTWWGMMDPTRTIVIDDVALNEGNAGTTAFVFTLELRDALLTELAPTPLTVTVEWDTSDGSAWVADGDYVPVVGGLVTFSPGETSKTVTVDVNGDLKYEGDETFFVDLTNPTNADIADPQATGTILNDDPLPLISIGDVSLLEGDGGPDSTSFLFPVTLSRLSSTDVQVDWATTPVGSTATAGPLPTGDYTASGGTAVIAAGALTQTVTVTLHGDAVAEPDEAFYVDLSSPVGGVVLRPRGAGIILDDDASEPSVRAFTAVTGLPVGSGQTLLQWLNPAGAVGADEVVIRFNEGPGCGFPATEADGTGGLTFAPDTPGDPQSEFHTGGVTNDQEYCYTAFLRYGVALSTGVSVRAVPFDPTPPALKLKWMYFTGATVLAAPTVGVPAVTALSNDMYVHSMLRGPSGGPWLGVPWRPWGLGSVAQHRAPTVPLPAGSRAYIATFDGRVHAIDTDDGTPLWTTQLSPNKARGAPAGIFTAYGGAWDYVFAGTSETNNNVFYALDPFTGAVVDTFDSGGGIGAILGMPAVDYANRRVYFTSLRGSDSATVWCLDLGPPGPSALTLRWKSDVPDEISGSPVLIRGRVYVVDSSSNAWSIEAADNLDARQFSLGDGDGKGFLFPDRRNQDLYVATQGKVHGLIDDTGGAGWSRKWPEIDLGAGTPSVVLLWPGTNSLFVGVDQHPMTGNAGGLLHINTALGSISNGLQLAPSPRAIGAPSLDIGYNLLHVGSEAGILYAVEVPF